VRRINNVERINRAGFIFTLSFLNFTLYLDSPNGTQDDEKKHHSRIYIIDRLQQPS